MTNEEWFGKLSTKDKVSILKETPCRHCAYYTTCAESSNCTEGIRKWLEDEHDE